jgi:cation transport protein ChaC
MWVFGYGSLIWDGWETAFRCTDKVIATLYGYRRDFNKASVRNWGSKSIPGPTLGLEASASAKCVGMAFNFPDEEQGCILKELRAREGGSFTLPKKDVSLTSGVIVRAVVPINDPSKSTYLGNRTFKERARLAAIATGSSGRCVDYVKTIRDKLEVLGIHDPGVEEFWKLVLRAKRTSRA